jgi:HSP20 family molecular chaperone IbpA
MSFFPRSVYADQGFTPLFRLLEDFDSYKSNSSRGHRTVLPSFQPKFDVRETEDAYELHGELAGINKKDISIEFSDPQTMVIRGRIERSYTSRNAPELEDANTRGAVTESGEASKQHQATVEDDEEYQNVTPVSDEEAPKEAPKKKAPKDKAKYWLSERSIGEFSRSFTFPTHVSQDSVSATLNEGILSVTVPKHKKTQNYRITIN